MHPFSALRSDKQESTPSDDLDIAPPSSSIHGESPSPPSSSSSFPLRIKLNSSDYVLRVSGSSTVGTLKRWILQRHSADSDGDPYLRLIVRGRMMAPDSAALDAFSVSSSDVVHAVLAKEEGRGAQARMLRRINRGSEGSARNAGVEERGDGDSLRRLWRRIGIDARGVVLDRSGEEESEDSSEEDEETDREDDNRERDGRGRRTRERRGFDRLRSTGMSREEVNTLRLYFARSVDRYIERRRILIRASNQWRNRSNATRDSEPDSDVNETRDRSDTGEDSTNSLLEVEAGDDNTGDSHGMSSNGRQPLVTVDLERGDHRDETLSTASAPATTAVEEEGEDILLDRRRMEDEWMSTQGPYSEFRMNLNTNNPLLLAAISGNATDPTLLSSLGNQRRGAVGAGLLFRRSNNNNNNNNMNGGLPFEAEQDDDDLMFGSLGPNGTFLRNNPNSAFHPYMGPLPSVGTDKDFVWGFLLGFFVGFIMLFWVWMPTVPHKQKIGIICGISFQLALNLLRKSGEGAVSI